MIFRSDLSKSAQLNSFYSIRKSNIEPWINNPDRLVKVLNDFWKSGLADSKFETELEGGNIPSVYSAIGEAETYRLLIDAGWKLSSKNSGPDFCGKRNGVYVYFEVIAPSPIDIPDHMLTPNWEPLPNDYGITASMSFGSLNYESVELRLTAAIKEKSRKFKKYIDKKYIAPDRLRVIVVSMMQLGMSADLTAMGVPSIVSAVYPAGPSVARFDVRKRKFTRFSLRQRPIIKNKNSAEIQTDFFMNKENKHIDAVVGIFHPYACDPEHKGAEVVNTYGRIKGTHLKLFGFPSYCGQRTFCGDLKIKKK